MIQTYQDCVDNLIDFLGGGPSDQVVRSVRQAIQEAYREIPNSHKWPYLYRHGRLMTQAPFNGADPAGIQPQATVQYQQSSGARPRMMTISGGTWPSWVAGGYIRIADTTGEFNFVAYRVSQSISATVITLDDEVNPGSDIPSGTEFILYQDSYLVPSDFIAEDQLLYEMNIGGMQYVHPRDWLYENRYVLSEGTPCLYTVTGDRQYPGRLVMRIVPWPSESRSIDFIYLRRPRPMAIQQASGGTVSVPSGSVTVTASAPSFTSAMCGSVIRVSGNAKPPSGPLGSLAGYNPAALEATIIGYVSPTVVTIDTPSPSLLSAVNYYVSDPVDFEPGAMLNAFLRCQEKCLAKLRTLKVQPQAQQDYLFALEQAKAAASPSFAGRRAGPIGFGRRRLRDCGFTGADQP